MTSEESAAQRAATYGIEHFADLGSRIWSGTRFPGGWLMSPVGEDLDWQCGVVCLAVLDDGRIVEESSSVPPAELIEKYTGIIGGSGDGGGDTARAGQP